MITGRKTTLIQRLLFISFSVAIASWWFFLQVSGQTDSPANYLFNAAYGVPFVLAAFFAYRHAWRWSKDRQPEIPAMVFLGTSFLFYAVAQFIWTYYAFAFPEGNPDISFADLFFLASVLLTALAMFLFVGHFSRPNPPARWVNVVVFCSLFVVAFGISAGIWWFVFPSLEGVVSVDSLYSALSTFTILLILLNIYRNWHANLRLLFFTLLGGMAVTNLADIIFAIRNNSGSYFNGDISDGLYAVSALLMLLAVMRNTPEHVEDEETILSQSFLKTQVLIPAAVILVSLIISARVAEGSYQNALDTERIHFQSRSDEVADAIDGALRAHVVRVLAVKAFFEGSNDVSAEEFLIFDRVLRRDEPDSTLAYVSPDQLLMYYSTMVENPTRILHDYRLEPKRSELFDAAKASGDMVISEPLLFASGRPGILFVVPIVKEDVIIGYVLGSTPLENVLRAAQNIYTSVPMNIFLSTDSRIIANDGKTIYDRSGRRLLDANDAIEETPSYSFPYLTLISGETLVRIDNALLTVTLSSMKAEENRLYVDALTLFASINLFGVLFALLLYSILSQQTILRTQLDERTASLRKSVRQLSQYKFFLDNVSEAVLVSDIRHKVVYANEANATLTGIPVTKMIGTSADALFVQTVVAPSEDVMKTILDKGYWKGESQVQHVDGTMRDVLLSVHTMRDDAKRPIGFVTIVRDISDRKAIEHAKSQFVSLVSHQLRAPMTQLRWLTDTLLAGKLTKVMRHTLEDMNTIIENENKFVGDLLNISRIERGVLKIDATNVGVGLLLKETVEPLRELAKDRRIHVTIADIPRTARVQADRSKAVEAIRNLVDNAIKYSPANTEVILDAVRNEDYWEIRVTDQGAGIPEELLPVLFDVKNTPSSATGSNGTSSGLGLYLTKKFIEAMGGTIRVETSTSGTIFFIRLPSAPPTSR